MSQDFDISRCMTTTSGMDSAPSDNAIRAPCKRPSLPGTPAYPCRRQFIFCVLLIYCFSVCGWAVLSLRTNVIFRQPAVSYHRSSRKPGPGTHDDVDAPFSLAHNNSEVASLDDKLEQFETRGNAPCRNIPDSLIIGFEKCGTVALRTYLSVSNHIFTPVKNNQGFNFGVKFCKYQSKQPATPAGAIRLEKMATLGKPARVFQVNPKMKLLLIVRDPVERLVSHYVHRLSLGLESASFEETIISMLDKNLPHSPLQSIMFTAGMYMEKLKLWMQLFPREQFYIVNGSNFVVNPMEELVPVERFLGVLSGISKTDFVFNEAKGFYCIRNKDLDGCMNDQKGRRHPTINNTVIRRLKEFYRPYNEMFFNEFGVRYSWNNEV